MENRKDKIVLYACGDLSLSGGVGRKVIEEGPESVFEGIKERLGEDYLFLANLESPITDRGAPTKDYPPHLRADPCTIDALNYLGVNVVNLANNHIFDFGTDGVLDTLRFLDEEGIHHFGCGKDDGSATNEVLLKVNGLMLGFIGFNEWPPVAKKNLPGSAFLEEGKVLRKIRDLKKKANRIILSLHFGYEFRNYPSPRQVRMCRQFIDHGVDVIIGHHPHVCHGFEEYKKGVIFYSLGNFAFDMGEKTPDLSRESFIPKIEITDSGEMSLSIIPVRMEKDFSISCSESAEKKGRLEGLHRMSDEIRDEKVLRDEWYETVRHYSILYIKSFWLNTIKRKRYLYPVQFPVSFIKSLPKRDILTSLARFLFSGLAFKNEFMRLLVKMRRENHDIN